ncbi:Hypothetical predicted protein [Scomber scombrus]|uniref:Uncharacterized protein n=1 Tax=Scomber scombrus TaxID=13677 RepID=A0AAV1N368_SCOSC
MTTKMKIQIVFLLFALVAVISAAPTQNDAAQDKASDSASHEKVNSEEPKQEDLEDAEYEQLTAIGDEPKHFSLEDAEYEQLTAIGDEPKHFSLEDEESMEDKANNCFTGFAALLCPLDKEYKNNPRCCTKKHRKLP